MSKHGRYTVELNSGPMAPETDSERLARFRRVAQELGYEDIEKCSPVVLMPAPRSSKTAKSESGRDA